MEESSLPSNLNILEKDYNSATHNKGELDERMLINEEDGLLASGSVSCGSTSASDVKVCLMEKGSQMYHIFCNYLKYTFCSFLEET